MVSGLHIPPSPTSHPAFHRCWVDFEITEAEDTKAGESRLHDPLFEGASRSETPSPFFRGASGCPRVAFPQSPLGVPLCPHGTLPGVGAGAPVQRWAGHVTGGRREDP